MLCFADFADGEPVVLWHGGSGRLFCHGGCAGTFVLCLARDAWQVEHDSAHGHYQLTPHEARSARENNDGLWRAT